MGITGSAVYLQACKCGKHHTIVNKNSNTSIAFLDKAGGCEALKVWEREGKISPEEAAHLRHEIEQCDLPEHFFKDKDTFFFLEAEGGTLPCGELNPSEWVN